MGLPAFLPVFRAALRLMEETAMRHEVTIKIEVMMMKKVLFAVSAFVFLALGGCPNLPNTDDTNQGDSIYDDDENLAGSIYAEECWSEWLRMDEDETWYISGRPIKINGSVSPKSVSLSKQSERVIQVTEGGQNTITFPVSQRPALPEKLPCSTMLRHRDSDQYGGRGQGRD
jgi:hypothetical protein